MTNETLIPTDDEGAAKEAGGLIAAARDLTVTDMASYESASKIQHQLRGGIKRIEEFFSPMKRAANAAWKTVCKRESDVLDPVKAEYKALGDRAGAWFLEDKRAREEADRVRLAEAARREAEAAEAQRKAEVAAKKKHLPPPPPPPAPLPPPPPPPPIPKTEGAATRSYWDFEIAEEGKLPRTYTVPDVGKIRAVVKAMKGETKIPGVRVFERATMSGRA